MTFQDQISGQAFKVINETSGNIIKEFSHLSDAQIYADWAHDDMPQHHFRIVEIKWCGGSKRLSDVAGKF